MYSDNEYCMIYYWGSASTFQSDKLYVLGDESTGLENIGDNAQCPAKGSQGFIAEAYNGTNFDTAACKASQDNNPYLDKPSDFKLLALQYFYPQAIFKWTCEHRWINDNYCDSLCQTDECGNDGNDCNGNCIDDPCGIIYGYWTFVTDYEGQYAGNYSVVCNDWIPNKLSKISSLLDVLNLDLSTCMIWIQIVDFNDDGYINFREFVSWFGLILNFFSAETPDKGITMNCSYCVGLDTYNIDLSEF